MTTTPRKLAQRAPVHETASMPPDADTMTWLETAIDDHQAMVWRFLRMLGLESSLAEDLTQEVFLVLMKAGPKDPATLGVWLRATARNIARNAWRKSRGRREVDWPSDDAIEDEWNHYARQDEGSSYREALSQCLEALPARQRKLVRLRYSSPHKLSRNELAEAIGGIHEEGIKSMLRRVKDALKTCVERRIER